jgi:hypothetical protein
MLTLDALNGFKYHTATVSGRDNAADIHRP